MLSDPTIQVIKAITPAVAKNALQITSNFYHRMLDSNPEVREFFNLAHQSSGSQPVALAEAVGAYFSNIAQPEILGPAIELIAQKHCSLGVQPEHYPIVGKHLLDAIAHVMGEAVTDEVVTAVTEAYEQLAQICIDREQQIYQAQKNVKGGWNGLRLFTVDRKVVESEEVTSFYLKPVDGGDLPDYLPGQYVTVKIQLGSSPTAPRNYSLSHAPGNDFFRISVKREPTGSGALHPGLVSSHLHDNIHEGATIEVAAPCGEFTLDPTEGVTNPAVFLAAGIGITPLISMLHSETASNSIRPLTLIHACRSEGVQAFRQEVADLQLKNPNLKVHSIYEDSASGDARGRLTQEHLSEWTDIANADFYCCGPPPFLNHALGLLGALHVDETRQHMEFFGPKQALTT